MAYPKELFSIREDLTRKNLEEYDRKRKNWYAAAEKLYPDYFKLGFRERMRAREAVNAYVGYSL